jgi:hypothetical protein
MTEAKESRCDKVRYPTRGIATDVRDDLIARRGGDLRVYKCKSCGGYHLTSEQPREVNR